jgi:monoamine oxidase
LSRTPLFSVIQRSFRLARHAVRTGQPVDEVVERARAAGPGLSRRQFLGGTAAAAGLALAGVRPFAARAQTAPGREVVIVGAGIAGLTAGYRLHQAGVPVRILEAQERTGGRMWSLRDDKIFPGQVAELGGELIDTNHVNIRNLAAELEIPLDDFAFDGWDLNRDLWFFDGRRITEKELVEAFVPVSQRLIEDLSSLEGDWVTYAEPNGGGRLDRMTIAQWLETSGAAPWLKKLLDVAYVTEVGLETDRQSALNFLLLIDPNPLPFRIYGGSDERFHVRGGNDLIPGRLAEILGNRIERGVRLEALRKTADGALVASVRKGQTSREITADHMVIAIPFTLLREVRLDDSLGLPLAKREAIAKLGYGTNSKLMVGFSDRIWRKKYESNGSTLTDLGYQVSWETSRLQPGKAGIITNFTGGRHGARMGEGTPEERAKEFLGQFDRIFPGAAQAASGKAVRFVWPDFAWTRGSYTCYLPGQWTDFGGVEGEPVGNLHFAGEHCSADAQGFMEGGCETGEKVAQEILCEMGAELREVAAA